jgi:hypothetical protein
MASSDSRSAHIRSRLSHPVIDADGHIVESTPVLLDYMREVGGPDMATIKNASKNATRGEDSSRRSGPAAAEPNPVAPGSW